MSITSNNSCNWDHVSVPCSRYVTTLYRASNGKMYCNTHFNVIEYSLLSSGCIQKIRTAKTTETIELIPTKISPKLEAKVYSTSTPLSSSQPISKPSMRENSRLNHSVPEVRTESLLGYTGTLSPIVCSAVDCCSKDVKLVYQGYFCNTHEQIIKNYRSIIDSKRGDQQELNARIAEQSLRKIPHPLYQKDIEALKYKLGIN